MIGRAIWTAAIAGVALVAVFAQIDRAARFSPGWAAAVPAPFRGFAQYERARVQIVAGNAESALAESRQLVRVRPMPAEHLALLARAELLAENPDNGLAALEAAGGRGWREPVSQLAMVEAALASRNYPVAAQRIAALIAVREADRAQLAQLVGRLAAEAEGREALAGVLAIDGYWHRELLLRASFAMTPPQFAAMVASVREQGRELPCSTLGRIARRFANQGEEGAAASLRQAGCR
ncbi:hypothetical protein [Alteraurantiacibacter aquimixticola]|uniref:Tetratricopeptide repeat protein n=1 Tax=Alteraurantiacibacter aquimixticola TaxID=2489173 RepID=A0A4T3EYL9_9SPHN|nr:hypothetical protein [Alteraurantiacibacter aquimixticola]TIX48959.1 hypothetical protein E5222_14585 [Alteraurantiacibacter aquimixticola]